MSNAEVRDQYDRLASIYDERWRAYVAGSLSFLRGYLGLSGGERVLDVACGTGELERVLVGDHPGLGIVGVDPSTSMLEVARKKFEGRSDITFETGWAEELPFADDSFDVVVTANSFHYFEDPVAALREMSRTSKPDGRVVVLDWSRDFLACRVCDIALKLLYPAYNRCYNRRELREMFEDAGLGAEKEQTCRFRVVWGLMAATGRTSRGSERPRTTRGPEL